MRCQAITTLDRTLADAFRAARWAKSGGVVICPRCFDGRDVVPYPSAQRRHLKDTLRWYRCRCCLWCFADRYGTVLHGSGASLRAWAQAALLPPKAEIRTWSPGEPYAWLKELRTRLEGTELLPAWQVELTRRGWTFEKLRHASAMEIRCSRSTTSATKT